MCRVGEHAPTPVSPAGTSVCGNFCIHIKCEVKHNGDMGMEHLWFKWVGHLWQSELLFWEIIEMWE